MVNITVSTFDPSLKVLRLIANYIGVLNPEDTIEFLEECGVANDLIERHENSSKIVYHIFKQLASSDKDGDHKLLVKIIADSTNPALYNKPELTEGKILEIYNEWLKRDRLHLVDFDDSSEYRITSYIPTSTRIEKISLEEGEHENDILKSVVEPYVKDIAEIRTSYKLLSQIVDVFSQKSFPVDQQLNDYYISLFVFAEDKIDHLHSVIGKLYDQENPSDAPPSFYIQPDIYKDAYGKPVLFKPFTNLYLAGKEMEQQEQSWDDIKKNMETCFGFIEKTYHTFEANKTNTFPHKEFFDEISKYLKHAVKVDLKEFFGFRGTNFFLKKIADDDIIIQFHPQKEGGTTASFCLMKAFVDYLQGHGEIKESLIKGTVPKGFIINYIKTHYKEIDPVDWNFWIKDVRNALRKIIGDNKNFIAVGTIDFQSNGYPVALKLPLPNSFTP